MPDEAAYAPNWWRILSIDLTIGLSTTAVGAVAATRWTPLAWAIVVLGAFYVTLVVRRFFHWRRLRSSRGA